MNPMSPILKDYTFNWNTRLRNYLKGSNPKNAILEYAHMRGRGVRVDSHTVLFAIKACSLLMHGIAEGEQVHAHVFKMGFESETITQTALLRMYGIFGDIISALKVFDETSHRDLVLWNALVATYAQSNQPHKAILLAHDMVCEGVTANEVTLTSIILACSRSRSLKQGKVAHGYALKNLVGFDTILCNALIDMYANCGFLSDAHKLLRTMRGRNVISWTSMINGCCNNNYLHEAVDLFKEMEAEGVQPDEVTVLGLVSMCAKMGIAELGNWLDDYVEKSMFQGSMHVVNALIDMHAKCGNIKRSCQIFDQMTERTIVSWTAMIQGLALHGCGVEALVRFSQMQREGFKPDGIVYLNTIRACSHAGLVEEGRQCFILMVKEHGLEPCMEHYGTMVDLLCRAGLLREAFEFMVTMPVKPDAVIWRMLIQACRDEGNIDLAREVVSLLFELDPDHSGNYIIKSNLHAMIGEWSCVEEVRDGMDIKEVLKRNPACSSIEVKQNVNIN